MRHATFATGLVAAGLVVHTARGDILLDQPHDFTGAAASFIVIDGTDAISADDIHITQRTRIDTATFWFITNWPNVPWDWGIHLHATTMEHQDDWLPWFEGAPVWDPFLTIEGATSITDLGFWPTDPTYRYWEVRFENLDIVLDPAETLEGIFWISPYGVGQNYPLTRSYIGTSNRGNPNHSGAWGRTIPWMFPGWNGITSNADLAMRLEGEVIPAPGALLPLVAMMVLRPSTRQRRRG